MLERFSLVASSNSARLYRCGLRGAFGVRVLHGLGVKTVYRLNPERLISDDPIVGLHSTLLRQATIDPKNPDPLRVKQIVHVMRADMLQGVSLALCDASGREAVSLVVGAWRLMFDGWSLLDVVREWNGFGAEWLPSDTFVSIRECLIDIAEGIGTRRAARG